MQTTRLFYKLSCFISTVFC